MNYLTQRLAAIRPIATSLPPAVINSIAVVLLLLACYQIAAIAGVFFPGHNAVSVKLAGQSSATAGHEQLAKLTQLHLFGRSTMVPHGEQKSAAPATQLPISLTGIMYSSDENKALAVISGGGDEDVYAVGETITGTHAKIVHIYRNYIVLSRNGTEERLALPDADLDEAPVEHQVSTSALLTPIVMQQAHHLLQDPGSFTQYVRFSQKRENGRMLGYQVSPGEHPQLFNALGFKDGDLAVSINGYHLNDTRELMNFLHHFSTNDSYHVELIRQGEHLKMNLQLPSLSSQENPS